jgi:PhzF family phenazine biosynthesis protein
MSLPIFQVDAFTNRPFAGNPAAVCLLSSPQPDERLQAIALEMNLSETAFLLPQADADCDYNLRWFTPTTEVDLCGHATLASAHILWSENYLPQTAIARFRTRSGLLTAKNNHQEGDWIELNFPAIASRPASIPNLLQQALNIPIVAIVQNDQDYIVEAESETIVRQMQPNVALLRQLPMNGVIVTSRGSEFDFVSRYFAPNVGIDEDPVTGYAHCCLAPYWGDRLQKSSFLAYQASSRGGMVKVDLVGDRILLNGQAITVLRGTLTI